MTAGSTPRPLPETAAATNQPSSTATKATQPAAPATKPVAYPAILQGFLGSLFMFAGSIGIGWIANGSPMIRHPIVIALRTEGWGVTVSAVLLTVGAMLLVRSWLRLGQRMGSWEGNSLKTIVAAIGAWSLPLLFAVPVYSRDVYAYIGQGRLMMEGQDPYDVGISALNNWFALGADPAWAEARTPYGPYFLWMAHAVVAITGAQPDVSVLLFRLLAAGGVLLCVVYVPKLAELHGINGARALWIAVANPLFLISFVASAHNDAIMVGFAVAGTYFAATKRPLLGILLVTLSIGIKPATVLLLPFIGLMWAGAGASWPRKFGIWAATASISFAILVVSGIPYGLGLGWAWAITDPTPGFTGYSPSGFLGQQIEFLGNALGLPGNAMADILRAAMKWGAVALVLVLMFRGDHSRVVRRMALAFAAIVLLSPIIQPWYILWFVPFLAVTGIRDDWQMRCLYVGVTFFVVFGAQDQLSVWSFVEVSVDLSSLAFAIALLFAFYLVFLDIHTRRLLVQGKLSRWVGQTDRRLLHRPPTIR